MTGPFGRLFGSQRSESTEAEVSREAKRGGRSRAGIGVIGVVVTNAIVLIVFVEQLREQGRSVFEALVEASQVRMRPILMTAFTTTFALLPLASFASGEGVIIGAELATVVIGGLISSTFLTLVVVPVVYTIVHVNVPNLGEYLGYRIGIGQRPAPSRF